MYTFTRYDIEVDLGTGTFRADRMTVTQETKVSELELLEGGCDRRITGSAKTIVLEGRYGLERDIDFFEFTINGIIGEEITNAELAGTTYPRLYAAKAVLTASAESGIGRFLLTLKEL